MFENAYIYIYICVFVCLFLQMSRVASKQPDDPPKCRPDERTWVCLTVRVASLFMK